MIGTALSSRISFAMEMGSIRSSLDQHDRQIAGIRKLIMQGTQLVVARPDQ